MENKINNLEQEFAMFMENLPAMSSAEKEKVIPYLVFKYQTAANGFYNKHVVPRGYLADKTDAVEFLEWIVAYSRKVALTQSKNHLLVGGCKNSSQEVDDALKINKNLKIKPAKINTKDCFGKSFQHTINIAEIDGKKYIIDPTFIQFFSKVYTLSGINEFIPGKMSSVYDYFASSQERLTLAQKLSSDGYLEVSEEDIKTYFDCWNLINDKSIKSITPATKTKIKGNEYWENLMGGTFGSQSGKLA